MSDIQPLHDLFNALDALPQHIHWEVKMPGSCFHIGVRLIYPSGTQQYKRFHPTEFVEAAEWIEKFNNQKEK